MSSNAFSDFDNLDDDVGLGEESREEFKRDSDEWYKMEKGQIVRGALLYFYPVDMSAVVGAREAAKEEGKNLSKDEMISIAKAALEKRAGELSKGADTLTQIERLDLNRIRIKKILYHYLENFGYAASRMGKDGPEADAVWKKLGEVKKAFSSVLLLYPMKDAKSGDLDKATVGTHFKVVPWRFSKPVFENIWKAGASLKENNILLATQDLKLECKDKQFQNIDVRSCGPAIWLKSEKFKTTVLTQALEWYEKLLPFKEYTTDALRAKLGLGGPSVSDVSAGVDFQDMLDNV